MNYDNIRRLRREENRTSFTKQLIKILVTIIATIIIGLGIRLAFFEIAKRSIQHQAKEAQNIILNMGEEMKRKQEERKAKEAPKIVKYQEIQILGKSWEECVKEHGRGRNELNEKVVRCKNGYKELIPIYDK
ncbi:MAG: hypothetical protein RKO24_17440 [Candidatus Competibacter sp.]|nr:hypothetical protein [Candidatus Competibacter sp.]